MLKPHDMTGFPHFLTLSLISLGLGAFFHRFQWPSAASTLKIKFRPHIDINTSTAHRSRGKGRRCCPATGRQDGPGTGRQLGWVDEATVPYRQDKEMQYEREPGRVRRSQGKRSVEEAGCPGSHQEFSGIFQRLGSRLRS